MGNNRFLRVGRIINTHGVRGELKVDSLCDSLEDFCALGKIFLDVNCEPLEVLGSRVHRNHVLLKISGVETYEQAEALKGKYLYAEKADIPLRENHYFIEDLKGCKVFDACNAKEYGTLKDVWNAGASDIYTVVSGKGKEYYVPIIEGTVEKIDLEANEIFINPLKGLFEDEN